MFTLLSKSMAHSPKQNALDALLIQAQWLFDGYSDTPLPDHAILMQAGVITAIGPQPLRGCDGAQVLRVPVVAPGFIDLQINGANGVLFNANPQVQTLETMMQGARRGGTAYALPTFITADAQNYTQALAAGAQALGQVAGVLGVHLEGPFLSPSRAGIHLHQAIRPLSEPDLQLLLQTRPGTYVLTLAPECADHSAIAALCAAGWVVLAGHTQASADCMTSAQVQGLRGCTHLFNAMAPLQGRQPGVVGSVLSSATLFASIIADGIHVHPANLRLAYQCLGDQRLCLVTDAMPTLGCDLAQFMLDDRIIIRQEDTLLDTTGTLAGAHLAMDQAVRNMVRWAGASHASALRMASTAPARLLGLQDQLGYLACGFRAGLSLLSQDLNALGVVVDGQLLGNPRLRSTALPVQP